MGNCSDSEAGLRSLGFYMVRNTLDSCLAVSIDNTFRDRDRPAIAAAIRTLRSSQSKVGTLRVSNLCQIRRRYIANPIPFLMQALREAQKPVWSLDQKTTDLLLATAILKVNTATSFGSCLFLWVRIRILFLSETSLNFPFRKESRSFNGYQFCPDRLLRCVSTSSLILACSCDEVE